MSKPELVMLAPQIINVVSEGSPPIPFTMVAGAEQDGQRYALLIECKSIQQAFEDDEAEVGMIVVKVSPTGELEGLDNAECEKWVNYFDAELTAIADAEAAAGTTV